MQGRMRSSALDSYFAIAANLGTHTFFMIFLPILFWCGYTNLGRAYDSSQSPNLSVELIMFDRMVHVLASGVFFSGFLKDMLCIPRPLSPPLNRITMSKSASLEYGFPSTHSTNAASVAVYILFLLHSQEFDIDPMVRTTFEAGSYAYMASIVLGRLYCGMHGFLDVVIGTALGSLLAAIQWLYGSMLDAFIHSGSFKEPFIVVLIILVLVRIHPEPAGMYVIPPFVVALPPLLIHSTRYPSLAHTFDLHKQSS